MNFLRACKLVNIAKIVFLSFVVSNCVSSSEDEKVLERSAQFRPAWANSDFSGEGLGEKFVVAAKKQVPKLELGMKQAQAAALQDPCVYGQNRIAADISAFAKDASLAADAVSKVVTLSKSKLSLSGYCPRLKSQSVYWELLENSTGNANYYDIYVLLTMSRKDHADGLEILASHFKSGNSSDEKKIYEKIAKHLSGE
jgi:hypothetical protein